MDHLTEDQFEKLLAGSMDIPDHLSECIECKTLLSEKQALANRLRNAFSTIRASDDLARRIHEDLNRLCFGNMQGGTNKP
jgi:hypothetical protein